MKFESTSEHVKEVYARYGLAVYMSQVLEYGIVIGFIILDLIPSKRHRAKSKEEWRQMVDEFTDGHFKKTMGRLITELKMVAQVPKELEDRLEKALKLRNRLVHRYFRERDAEFLSYAGRELMLQELGEARNLFKEVDEKLEQILIPLLHESGVTKEIIDQEFQRFLRESDADKVLTLTDI